METLIPPSPRELALVAGLACVLLLGVANYLANHASVKPLPRLAYTVLVVFVCGTLLPAAALRGLTGSGVLRSSVLVFEPLELTAALVGGLAILAFFLRGQPQAQRWRAPVLVVALFGPSLAEVLVFAGIVFTAAEYVLAPGTGPLIAAMGAALASSAAFALYHLTHGAPWNQWRMIRTLFAVWLLVAGTYAWTTNLWAAVIVNTCMATIGFIKGRVTRAEEQPLLVSVGLDLVAVVALMVIVSTAA